MMKKASRLPGRAAAYAVVSKSSSLYELKCACLVSILESSSGFHAHALGPVAPWPLAHCVTPVSHQHGTPSGTG
eukprot:6712057-Prymnesium_polylepis.1